MNDKASKPVRLIDIAKAADVSVSTVSLALSDHPRIGEETKRRLKQFGRELGYRRPTGRKRRTSKSDGVEAPANRPSTGCHFGCLLLGSPLRNEINMELLNGLVTRATAADARVELGSLAADISPEQGIEQAIRFAARLDGVVLSGLVSLELLEAFDKAQLPHVVIGHVVADPTWPFPGRVHVISHDETSMGRLATRSLFDAGHRQVAFISERAPRYLWADRWLSGYKLAHIDADYPCVKPMICTHIPVYEDVGPVIDQLLAMPKPPTAYVVPDARVGRSVIDALERRTGRSPHEAMVVGCSAAMARSHRVTELARIQPEPCKLAQAAFDHLIKLGEQGMSESMEIVLPFSTCNLNILKFKRAASATMNKSISRTHD